MKNLLQHEYSKLYPEMDDVQFQNFLKDITSNGFQNPVIQMYEGKVLDGWHRYQAALTIQECDPSKDMLSLLSFKDFQGFDPLAFVHSINGHRRHLTQAQLAVIALRHTKMQQVGRPEKNIVSDDTIKSSTQVAQETRTSRETVQRAKRAMQIAPDRVDEMVEGKVTPTQIIREHVVPKAVAISQSQEVVDEDEIENIILYDEFTGETHDMTPEEAESYKDNLLYMAGTIEKSLTKKEVLTPTHKRYWKGEEEWYTSSNIVEGAFDVMGGIDLDPASNPVANKYVKADKFFTKDDDGLEQDWYGRVFMNPPFTKDVINKFTGKLITEYEQGNVTEAILLVESSNQPLWFSDLVMACDAYYMHTDRSGRFYYWNPNEDEDQRGQSRGYLFYFGGNVDKFVEVFKSTGVISKVISE